MSIVSIANPKGGSGKTTTTLLMGTGLAKRGASVTIIDADPEAWLTRWSRMPNKPDNINVVSEFSVDSIFDTVASAKSSSDYVLIDMEGTASVMASNCVLISDFVVVPTQGSPMDAVGAVKMVNMVTNQAKAVNRNTGVSVLFTRTSAALTTRSLKSIELEFHSAGLDTFKTKLVERSAYRELSSFGGTLETLPRKDVSNVDKAIINADQFVEEFLGKLERSKTAPNNETPMEESA